MFRKSAVLCILFNLFFISYIFAADGLSDKALKTLDKGIKYFHSISTNGGYLWAYSLDLKKRWGEGYGIVDYAADTQVWIQPPGTPSVGNALLRAYNVTGERFYLTCAEDAGNALIMGQKKPGGWEYKIDFSKEPGNDYCALDDNNTQSALRFLMALCTVSLKESLHDAVEKGIKFMLESQFKNGAWPQWYPLRGGYHDFFTFNDRVINDCIDVMIDAHRIYGKSEYLESIKSAGDFLILSQLPPPQPGWAQQYNHYLQPAWARVFEPPSVCSFVTEQCIKSLIDLYLYTGRGKYLEPIPDAIRWLRESKLPGGACARFYELGTNRPLYYDRGRKRVETLEELSIERQTGYRYHVEIMLDELTELYNSVKESGREGYLKKRNKSVSQNEKIERMKTMEAAVRDIISSQDEMGRWVVEDKRRLRVMGNGKWNGKYEVEKRIKSIVFIDNVNLLCDYIEPAKSIK